MHATAFRGGRVGSRHPPPTPGRAPPDPVSTSRRLCRRRGSAVAAAAAAPGLRLPCLLRRCGVRASGATAVLLPRRVRSRRTALQRSFTKRADRSSRVYSPPHPCRRLPLSPQPLRRIQPPATLPWPPPCFKRALQLQTGGAGCWPAH